MFQEVEKLGQLPAACQVEPAVSSSRSSSTASVQPSRVRWYSALQPTAPPPMTTTRAWLFMNVHAAAPGCAPDSTLHPRARRVIESPQRDPGGNALRSDLHLVLPRGDPLGADRHAAVGDVAETQGSTEGMAEHPGGDPPDEFTVPPDRLVVIQQAIRALEGDRHESAPDAGLALAHERLEARDAARVGPGGGEPRAAVK